MQCRICGKAINLRSKREHMNRLHDECNTIIGRAMHMGFSEEDCINAAIAAEKRDMELITYLAIKHVKEHAPVSPPSREGSKYKFVNTTNSKTKPWRAEVEIEPHVWLVDKRFATEEEAIECVLEYTTMKRECLLLLKNYRLSSEVKRNMFIN